MKLHSSRKHAKTFSYLARNKSYRHSVKAEFAKNKNIPTSMVIGNTKRTLPSGETE